MPAIKPALSDEQVIALLQEHFPTPIEHLSVINNGQIAQTYSFTSGGQDYIVRFNRDNMGANFPKEAFIAGRITSPRIPIPENCSHRAFSGTALQHHRQSSRSPSRSASSGGICATFA